jgi:hypothetical protein
MVSDVIAGTIPTFNRIRCGGKSSILFKHQLPSSSANNVSISQVLKNPITASTNPSIFLAPRFNLNNITPIRNRDTSYD